jgi:uncharacterized membrane protein
LPTRQFDGLSAPVDRVTYRYGADELVGALRDGGHSIQSLPDRHPVPTLIPQIYADALKSGKF